MFIQSKKALSIVVGYVLLIVFASVIGVIVYKWQATYVPQDEYAACPEGASLFIDNINYDCTNDELTFDVTNNGKFSIGGYFIYVKDAQEKTIATLEISNNNTNATSRLSVININGVKLGGYFPTTDNEFLPGAKESEKYTMVGIVEPIYGIEIVPIRWQQEGRKEVLASCKEVRITEPISGCGAGLCIYDGQACVGRECGTVMNNCYEYFECGNPCPTGEFCDSEGQCVTSIGCIPQTCEALGYECGTQDVGCGVLNTCGDYGGGCPTGEHCEAGTCVADGSGGGGATPDSCPDVCASLGYTGNPILGLCRQNAGQCSPGVHESSGDIWCAPGGPQADTCCCYN